MSPLAACRLMARFVKPRSEIQDIFDMDIIKLKCKYDKCSRCRISINVVFILELVLEYHILLANSDYKVLPLLRGLK